MESGFLSELNKLKNSQEYLEKSNKVINNLSKYDYEENLSEYYETLENERKNETNQVTNQIRDIWRSLIAEKTLLRDGNVDALDLRSFKKRMIELQERMHTIQIKMVANYEILKDHEVSILEALETYNSRLPEWEKPVNIQKFNGIKINKKSSQFNSDYKEVKEFMDFVNKSNGPDGGWSSEDHQLFLKLRNKHKSINDLAINLNKLLPDITPTAVREHEAWYQKYLFLKNKKDEALKKWRTLKNEKVSHNNDDKNDENLIKNKIFTKCKDENVQQKIAEWKSEREAKRQQQKLAEQMRKEELKNREMEKRKLHYQIKESVAKWKEDKVIKEFNEKIQKELIEEQERRLRALEANKMIKRFQSQDDIFIVRMKSSKLSKKSQPTLRSKSSYSVARDPERLLKPTKQWLIRTSKDNYLEEKAIFIPNIREVPKLGIPEWRKQS